MTCRLLITLLPMWVGMALLLGGTGCATRADLGKLNQGLTQKLEALDSSVHGQVEDLRTDLKTTQATHTEQYDELKTMLAVVKTDMATANLLTEYWSKTMQRMKKITAWTEEVNEQLGSVRQLRVAVEQLPLLLTGLASEMHSLRQALLNGYKLEEAALRERLKALDHMQRQLEASLERSPSGKLTAQ